MTKHLILKWLYGIDIPKGPSDLIPRGIKGQLNTTKLQENAKCECSATSRHDLIKHRNSGMGS